MVSFINATLVLSIGETVEEVTDSGFLGTTPTLSCSQLGEDALLQVLYLQDVCDCFRSLTCEHAENALLRNGIADYDPVCFK